MKLIEKIKKWLNIEKSENNSIEQERTTNLSIIDISNLEIDRNLTKEENESRKRLLEEISSGNFSTFINYGNDIAKQINYYMDIVRKRLNQNIEQNQSISRKVSLEQAIRQKVQIIFNNAEIDSILDDLSDIKRNCELRIIALEDLGNIELKKSKKRIFFFGDKTDESKVASINNTISRLSAQINILNMLTTSIKNEQATYMNENYSLDEFINYNNSKEANKIANRVLSETFEEVKRAITSISTFSNIQSLVIDGVQLDKIDIDEMPLDKKVEIIALSKRYLDFYVAQNREKLLSKGGILDRAKEYQNQLWEEIESDYLDVPLWAKKAFRESDKSIYPDIKSRVYHKYYERIENIEKLISVFGEEIPEDFKESFYKTKFYFYTLYNETRGLDSITNRPFEIVRGEERKYYLKFITEIVDKIHRESDDAELLKFMDKHLSLKNPNAILDHYDKFVALLRIEKLSRDGLFTLILYTADFKDNSHCYCCLDQINPKYLSEVNLEIYEFYQSSMAKDILKMWKSTKNLDEIYNGFWGDYNDCWEFAEKVNPALYPRSNPSNWNWVYNVTWFYSWNSKYWPFLVNTIKDYNKFARKNGIELKHRFSYFFKVGMHTGQYLAMYAYLMEEFSHNQLSREDVFRYIKNNGKITEYSVMTSWILEDYLKENLSEESFKYFNAKFREGYFFRYLRSANRLKLWKRTNQDTRQFGEVKTLDFDFYKFIVDVCNRWECTGNMKKLTSTGLFDLNNLERWYENSLDENGRLDIERFFQNYEKEKSKEPQAKDTKDDDLNL